MDSRSMGADVETVHEGGFGRAHLLGVEWFETEVVLGSERLERFEWLRLLERCRWVVEA